MSASRVVSAEGMDVDEAGVALPTPEWMEAARKAADTDGILENASAKRQKVCISCNTLTSPAHRVPLDAVGPHRAPTPAASPIAHAEGASDSLL